MDKEKMENRLLAMETCTAIIADTMENYRNSKYDVVDIDCECGRMKHSITAKYCTDCGKKLEKIAINDSL